MTNVRTSHKNDVWKRVVSVAALAGYDNAYYDTLFYENEWHTVRVEDRIHVSADGRIRAAKVLAASIQTALGMD